eukprot:755093-Hanusia_phi.AAC.5
MGPELGTLGSLMSLQANMTVASSAVLRKLRLNSALAQAMGSCARLKGRMLRQGHPPRTGRTPPLWHSVSRIRGMRQRIADGGRTVQDGDSGVSCRRSVSGKDSGDFGSVVGESLRQPLAILAQPPGGSQRFSVEINPDVAGSTSASWDRVADDCRVGHPRRVDALAVADQNIHRRGGKDSEVLAVHRHCRQSSRRCVGGEDTRFVRRVV